MDYLTEQRRKLTAALRKQRELEHRFATIEWERDVLRPEVEALEKRITRGERVEIKLVNGKVSVQSALPEGE